MDSRYLNARFSEHARHVVLGRRLHPFCLDDVVALARIGSPFYMADREPAASDLRLAVVVCSSPFGELDLTFDLRRALWCLATAGKSFEDERAKFNAYLSEFYFDTGPECWTRKGGGKMPEIPWVESRIARLIAAGVDESRARTMPLSLALWRCLAIAENEGADVKLVTDRDRALLEEVRAAETLNSQPSTLN